MAASPDFHTTGMVSLCMDQSIDQLHQTFLLVVMPGKTVRLITLHNIFNLVFRELITKITKGIFEFALELFQAFLFLVIEVCLI